MNCKFCGGVKVIRWGKAGGVQNYRCTGCGHRFRENGKFVRMRTGEKVIVAALDLYFEGLSIRKVRRQIAQVFGVRISHMTVWRWLVKYSELVSTFTSTLTPELSGEWHVDETAVKVKGEERWFWDCIDHDTRFLVATHLSEDRSVETVVDFLRKTARNRPRPQTITTDGLQSYHNGINKVYYSNYRERKVIHQRAPGLRARRHNNPIERFHNTLKERYKIMRTFKTDRTGEAILEGFVAHYNFVRRHTALDGARPAEVAKIPVTIEDGWGDLIRLATRHDTAREQGLVMIKA